MTQGIGLKSGLKREREKRTESHKKIWQYFFLLLHRQDPDGAQTKRAKG